MLDYGPPAVVSAQAVEAMCGDFGKGVVVTLAVLVLGAIRFLKEPPDPPLAGLCIVVGVALMTLISGLAPLWVVSQVRRGMLNGHVRMRSKAVVYASGGAYAAQVAMLGTLIWWLHPAGRYVGMWALVPIVPVLAPLWIMPRTN